MHIKLKGQAATANGSVNSTNLALAQCVLVQNTGTSAHLVTHVDADNTTIGSFHIPANAAIRVEKEPTDKIYAASTDVKFTAIAFRS